nr:hypothetical protein [Photorhabdus asymbiotica]
MPCRWQEAAEVQATTATERAALAEHQPVSGAGNGQHLSRRYSRVAVNAECGLGNRR